MKTCLTVSLLVLMGCAGQRTASSKCEPVPDSFAIAGVVYRDCAVDSPARAPAPPPRPEFSTMRGAGPGCFRAIIDVAIDTNGRPIESTAKVVRTTNPEFTAAVMATLPQYRYEPALKNGVAVQQLVRIDQMVKAVVVASPGSMAARPNVPNC